MYSSNTYAGKEKKKPRYIITVDLLDSKFFAEVKAYRAATGVCISHELRKAIRTVVDEWQGKDVTGDDSKGDLG